MPREDDQEILRAIGANVARLRERRGWTQNDLARSLSEVANRTVDVRLVQRVERAQINFGVTLLPQLAHALGVPIPSLFKPAQLATARKGRPKAKPQRL
jgi:transcriptional regulator with XRE-family HTH domain